MTRRCRPRAALSAALTRRRGAQFVKGDIQSADLMNFVLKEDGIDTIMHFAAQVCVLPRWLACLQGPAQREPCVGALVLL